MLAFAIGALDPKTKLDEKAIMKGLLVDLRKAAAGKHATDKFIASFVFELEKRASIPLDLGKEVADPSALRLGPVSTTLLLMRYSAGIQGVARTATPAGGGGGGVGDQTGRVRRGCGAARPWTGAADCKLTPSAASTT